MSKIQKIIENTNNSHVVLLKSQKFDFLPPKPILKWVGGKTQILEKIIGEFPKKINNYHEIFVGGCSVLFAILYLQQNNIIDISGTVNAYDLNLNLINMYNVIQTKPLELYKQIKSLINDYTSIEDNDDIKNKKPTNRDEGMTSKESYYYWVRKQYNTKPSGKNKPADLIKYSSMFIFLNKTCFRGLHRVGPNGFNVPYGNYKNPSIIDKEHLMEISKLIKNVNFHHMDFSESLKKPVSNDFIYMDPPYAPENDKSFVSYTDGCFDVDKHLELFNKCNELKKSKINFMISNSDVELVRSNFVGYSIESIDCKRSINSKNPGSKTKEVIIKSY